ncbi:MAG TPA: HAD-IC family P-type ATPase [Longimicrobiales bacterium]|nr:HAD-IC family P-type ATPase [Longimicrobiales bacterium]
MSEPWHTLPVDEVERVLAVADGGLTEDEAAARLLEYGFNEVEEERETPWWMLLLRQFTDPLIYILLGAAVVTLILRDYSDTGVILAVVLLNAVIGFVQERRAQQAMRALARMSAPGAEVIRGGAHREIPSREVVPGDVVVLASGVRVPADVRLIDTRDLEADESALTGESLPVRKQAGALEAEALVPGDQLNMAFAGTVVTRGRGRGITVRTAAETELGRIATVVREIGQTPAPLQETMARFGRRVGLAILALAVLTAAVGLLRGLPFDEIFMAAVALAVSAIPEGLPVVLTVTLAIGVSRMARRNAIIRALPAVETLGSTTVIGSDKTGTLTKNEMSVRAIWAGGRRYEVTGAGYGLDGDIRVHDTGASADAGGDEPLRRTLLGGTLANEADRQSVLRGDPRGDPTEIALHVAAAKAGLAPDEQSATHPELDILPFEPDLRLMATLNDGPDGRAVYVKGAPESVLGRCDTVLTREGEAPLESEPIREAAARLAAEGLRVLAMAFRLTDDARIDEPLLSGGLVFVGLQGMEDPVRPEVIDAIRATGEAGIRVLMLTGDHVDTARAIGRQLGLDPHGTGALEGHAIGALSDAELDRDLQRIDIYARVAPEHKLRIVQRLRAGGEVVAVTGDGVNDAPALREAHLGIAMGRSGTDVAKEASDMVLADDNFATIVAAVEEGRVIFSNIRKVTFFLLSTAVGEILVILAALLAGWPLPFLAAQILWINLVTNGLQDIALAFEPGEPGLLRRPPRARSEGILTRRVLERLGAVGVVLAAGTLGMFWWVWRSTDDIELARTTAMTQMVVFQFFHVFNCRSLDRSIFEIPPLSNRFLFLSLIAALGAHLAALHLAFLQGVFRTQPLSLAQWGLTVLVGTTVIVGGELDKWWSRRRKRPLG